MAELQFEFGLGPRLIDKTEKGLATMEVRRGSRETRNYFLFKNKTFIEGYHLQLNLTEPQEEEFTLTFWVKTKPKNGEKMVVVDYLIGDGTETPSPHGYRVFVDEKGHWALSFAADTIAEPSFGSSPESGVILPAAPALIANKVVTITGPVVKFDGWTHIAISYKLYEEQGMGEMNFYVDGICNEGWQHILSTYRKPTSDNLIMLLGKGHETESGQDYVGAMAHFRGYTGSLTGREVRNQMATDIKVFNQIKQPKPLDFNFFNEDERKIIYMNEDDEPNSMQVEILNTASKKIIIPKSEQKVSAKNYHFMLSFRPGVLGNQADSEGEITSISIAPAETDEAKWELNARRRSDNVVEVYLLKQSEDIELPTTTSLTLKLNGLVADSHYGSRGTYVDLTYRDLQLAEPTNKITGTQRAHLNIASRLGRKNIPLHVGFIGSNTVLNDGVTANKLTLRIRNISEDYTIKGGSDDDTDNAPQFTFSFKHADIEEAALTSQAGIGMKAGEEELRNEGAQSQTGVWVLPLQGDLKPDDSIEIVIDNIICDKPTGTAFLLVQYEDIPDYQDGDFVVPIEKGPMVFRAIEGEEGTEQRVGIGTAQPSDKLQVKGGHLRLDFEQNITTDSSDTFEHNSKGMMHYGLGWYSDRDSDSDSAGSPRAWLSGHGGIKMFTKGISRLVIDKDGNVGIGIGAPSDKLHIGGGHLRLDFEQNITANSSETFVHNSKGMMHYGLGWYSDSDNTGSRRAWLSGQGGIKMFTEGMSRLVIDKDGNMGIGIDAPSDKLHIDGGNLRLDFEQNITADSSETFEHNSKGMMHYGLGWYSDSDNAGSRRAWLSGQGGIKMFTQGMSRLVIDKDGNVGIGIGAPSDKLHIDGGNLRLDFEQNITTNSSETFEHNSKDMMHYGLGWYSDSDNAGSPRAWLSGHGGIKMFTKGRSRLVLDGDGNVIIGDESTGIQLKNNGEIRIKDTPPFAVRVFEIFRDNTNVGTGFNSADYEVFIGGFTSTMAEANENRGLKVWTHVEEGEWKLFLDIKGPLETRWVVRVIAIRRELIESLGQITIR